MQVTDDAGVDNDFQARHIRPTEAQTPGDYSAVHDRWAVVVGISKYRREPKWNLQFADKDARELAKLIRTPSGGGFEADHVLELINGKATTANIVKALRRFLQRPAREDVVLIYFACHGVEDPDRPQNLYLLTHDADPNDIPGSALPMREIEASLRDNLLAERVIIVADTCHSGALGSGGRGGRNIDSPAAIHRYMKQVGEAKPGTALLTSAEASETSYEDRKWGGGHGVFTHFLLEGMRGNADLDKDGVVSVGELFEYVRDQVKSATGDRQHPAIGTTQFDRKLPVSVPGGDLAALHIELAEALCSQGRWLDDRRFFRSAQRHLAEAERVSPRQGPASTRIERLRGLTHDALDEDRLAAKAFANALRGDGTAADALNLGVAEAKLGNGSAAAAAFARFLEMEPDSRAAELVREYATWLKGVETSARRALLIGIGSYPRDEMKLPGPVTDVELLRDVLVDKFRFAPEHVRTLTDSAATRQAIVDQFQELNDCTSPSDSVVVHFSGHSVPGVSQEYLLVYDSRVPDRWPDGDIRDSAGTVRADELHEWMNAIPAKHKTLILDTHPNDTFLTLARSDSRYSLMMASSTGLTYEKQFERNGSQLSAGIFTYLLVEQLAVANPHSVTYADIAYPLSRAVQAEFSEQSPFFVGIRARRLFGDADEFLGAIQFSRRRNYRDLTPADIERRYLRCREAVASPFPELHASFGRAFLAHADYSAALESLRTAAEQCEGQNVATTLALGVAQACTEHYREALESLLEFRRTRPQSVHGKVLDELERHVRSAARGRKHALLVGISEYAYVPGTLRATDDVAAVKEVLCTKYGFDDDGVTVLIDGEATDEAIRESFTRLVNAAREDVAVFYFAGKGSTGNGDVPTIVSYDGRQGWVFDIELRELAALAGTDTRLITIIDADWAPPDDGAPSRWIEPDARSRSATRGVGFVIASDRNDPGLLIGQLSLYAGSIGGNSSHGVGELSTRDTVGDTGAPSGGRPKGKLSFAVVMALWAAVPGRDTWVELIRDARSAMTGLASGATSASSAAPIVVGIPLDSPLFSSLVDPAVLVALWALLDQHEVDRLIELLQRVIERQNDQYPECYVDLGIAYAAKGLYAKSIDALETALRQTDGDDPAACYWLGRTLFESRGDLTAAVSRLREATKTDPGNARAKYYLGQSIRLMVEQDLLSEAEQALSSYLEAGAPLGDHDAVQEFVLQRMRP